VKYLIVFLLMCKLCFAADIYVNGDSGTDDTVANGYGYPTGTENGPMLTIDYAYTQASNGDTIKVEDATYDAATQGAGWQIDIDRAGIGVTIEPAVSTDTITLDIAHPDNGVLVTATQTVAINNLTITTSTASALFTQTAASTLTVTDCILSTTAANDAIYNTSSAYAGTTTFEGCTITCADAQFTPFLIRKSTLFTINNCTVTMNGTPSIGLCYVLDSVNNVVITNCTIDTSGSTSLTTILDVATNGVLTSLDLSDNTITLGDHDVVSITTQPAPTSAGSIVISRNTITDGQSIFLTEDEAVTSILVSDNTQSSQYGGNGVEIGKNAQNDAEYAGTSNTYSDVRVINNTLAKTGAAAGHNMMIGSNTSGAIISGNYCSQTQTDDFGIVIKGSGALITNNIVTGRICLYLLAAKSCEVYNNTLYATTASAILWDVIQTTESENCIIKNNILDASGGGTLAVQDGPSADRGHEFNNNCLVAGSTAISDLGGVNQSTLAAVQAKWATYSTLHPDNAQSSINADPKFIDTTDFKLGSNSPCLGIGRYNEEYPLGRNRYNYFGSRR
jgi:hypothetical protein